MWQKSCCTDQAGGNFYNQARTVWIPPGQWEDSWTGKVFTGPANISVQSSVEQFPLYHRRPGLLLTADSNADNVGSQNRSRLVIEAFPGENGVAKIERFWDPDGSLSGSLHASIDTQHDRIVVGLGCPQKQCEAKSWLVRLHLQAQQEAVQPFVDGSEVTLGLASSSTAKLLPPSAASTGMAASLQGTPGVAPPPMAGAVVEVEVNTDRDEKTVHVQIRDLSKWTRGVVV